VCSVCPVYAATDVRCRLRSGNHAIVFSHVLRHCQPLANRAYGCLQPRRVELVNASRFVSMQKRTRCDNGSAIDLFQSLAGVGNVLSGATV